MPKFMIDMTVYPLKDIFDCLKAAPNNTVPFAELFAVVFPNRKYNRKYTTPLRSRLRYYVQLGLLSRTGTDAYRLNIDDARLHADPDVMRREKRTATAPRPSWLRTLRRERKPTTHP
jgi:hypothetical protein